MQSDTNRLSPLGLFAPLSNPAAFIDRTVSESRETPAVIGAVGISLITAAVNCLPQVLFGEPDSVLLARAFINKCLLSAGLFLVTTWLLAQLGRRLNGTGTTKNLRHAHGALLLHLTLLCLPCLALIMAGVYTSQLLLLVFGQLAMLTFALWVAVLSIRATAIAHRFNIRRARLLHAVAGVPLVLLFLCASCL